MNILVTGGSSGLGREITTLLAADPANTVYFTYNRSVEAARDIEKRFPNTNSIACDFGDGASLQSLLDQITEMDLGVLVNNAHAKYTQQHFYKVPPEAFVQDFQLNVLPALQITRQAISMFRKKKFGKIINVISSAVVGKPPAGMSVYTAQKAYMLSMSKSWAAEGIRFNITSNCVSPAFMATTLTEDYDERMIEQMIAEHPLKQLLQPKSVAEAVLFLARASQQVNGTNIVLNAGAEMA